MFIASCKEVPITEQNINHGYQNSIKAIPEITTIVDDIKIVHGEEIVDEELSFESKIEREFRKHDIAYIQGFLKLDYTDERKIEPIKLTKSIFINKYTCFAGKFNRITNEILIPFENYCEANDDNIGGYNYLEKKEQTKISTIDAIDHEFWHALFKYLYLDGKNPVTSQFSIPTLEELDNYREVKSSELQFYKFRTELREEIKAVIVIELFEKAISAEMFNLLLIEKYDQNKLDNTLQFLAEIKEINEYAREKRLKVKLLDKEQLELLENDREKLAKLQRKIHRFFDSYKSLEVIARIEKEKYVLTYNQNEILESYRRLENFLKNSPKYNEIAQIPANQLKIEIFQLEYEVMKHYISIVNDYWKFSSKLFIKSLYTKNNRMEEISDKMSKIAYNNYFSIDWYDQTIFKEIILLEKEISEEKEKRLFYNIINDIQIETRRFNYYFKDTNEFTARMVDSLLSVNLENNNYTPSIPDYLYNIPFTITENDIAFFKRFKINDRLMFRKAIEKCELGIQMMKDGYSSTQVRILLEYATSAKYEGKTYNWPAADIRIKGRLPEANNGKNIDRSE